MASNTLAEKLASHGWVSEPAVPFAEQVGQGADACYTYLNGKGQHLSLVVFEQQRLIRFRVFSPTTREVSWLQIAMDGKQDAVIAEIVAQQEQIVQEATFRFYMGISEFENVSILAWEQWEAGYK
jgi:hypothetical protein